jgi:uncharacterized membrane protein
MSTRVPAEPANTHAGERASLGPIQLGALTAVIIGYAVLSHYSASSTHTKGLGAALSVGPVLLIGGVMMWRWTRPWIALLAAAVVGAFLYRYWPIVESNYQWADLVQQCGVYALIALSFARTLSGRVPLCTQLAIKMHGELTPAEIAYGRRATIVWMVFYAALAITIIVLYFSVSLKTWSFFVNFTVFGLIVLASLAEHAIRRRVLPYHPSGGILAAIQRALTG